MQKETATEWLFKYLWEEPKDKFTWNAILDKAKEMEKQQIEDAYRFGIQDEYVIGSEQYYNQTYKQD
jgi:hypothetical protein